ncbi:hypothetical protein [Amycolatopsis rubida]|uniref:Uncharacterized protein n=1 Tax=Amycolatopsis rubida TaxID=112413 RepID=A0A1I5TSJ6_9PSEU|nr:hypothetical protein [Amycolatopsis rubida]SFP85993.1 hypothetical protein SAMN05421854_107218 [Amycolatopsis rubida]
MTADNRYDACCCTHGANVEGNGSWVRELGDTYKQGYVAAYYLQDGATAGVATKCG